LTKFDISSNEIRAEGGKALAAGLKGNQVITELNISSNSLSCNFNGYRDTSGVIAITDAITDMRALSHLDVSNNELGQLVPPEGWTGDYIFHSGDKYHWTHTDGRKEDGVVPSESKPGGIIALANVIPGMGALSIANVMGNSIGKEMLSKLQDITRSKPNLVSLCGIADDATEADLSGLGMDADDAIILASELPDKGAISSINLLKNNIPVKQAQELVKLMQTKENLTTLCGLSREETELDFSDQYLGAGDVVLIANDIIDMRALSVLSLKANRLLTAEAGKILSDMLAANSVLTELDVSNNNWDDGETYLGDGPGFAQALSVGIRDSGALLSLNLASNSLCGMDEYGNGTYDASGNACFHCHT
jgi:Leucine-rich repeat (LRR) protein